MVNGRPKAGTGVVLVGAGMIAGHHVAALSALQPRARLSAVVSRRPERARHLAELYNGPAPAFTSDLAEVVARGDVGVAVVATPPDARIEIIRPLADAGVHILLEKPVARSTAEAVEVVETCEAAGVTLGVLLQHRVQPSASDAARLLAQEALGKIGHIEIAVPLWRPQSYYDEPGRGTHARDGGGVLLTQAIHTIDLALSLTGPVTYVQAMCATTTLHDMESEDLAVAGLRFASGAIGSLVASTATFPPRRETITLHGERGSMRLGRDRLDLDWRDAEADRIPFEASPPDNPSTPGHELHRRVIADFLDAIECGRPPLVTGRAALAAHRLIEAMTLSSQTGRVIEIGPA